MLADDNMVQKGDFEQAQGLGEVFGQKQVGGARVGVAGGVVVGADNGAGVMLKCGFERFSRVDFGAINAAKEELFIGEDPVFIV